MKVQRSAVAVALSSLVSGGSLIVGCTTHTIVTAPEPAATTPPVVSMPAPDQSDAGAVAVDAGPDHGKPSSTYPAFKPDVGQLVDNHGGILANPVVVTITWGGDTHADQFEDFGDKIGPSQYWKAAVGEYGVGPATSGPTNHVRIADMPPGTFTTDALAQFVSDNASAANLATSKWPAATDQTIYVIYLPYGVMLDMGGGLDACAVGVGGYHDSTLVDGNDTAYAIIPQCSASDLDVSTESASHEIGEASTDPHPSGSKPGWFGFDDNHVAWQFFQQGQIENGDNCEFYQDSFYQNTDGDLPFSVQRLWSNASIAAGHAPCSPAPAGPYFNVTAIEPQNITLNLTNYGGKAKQATKGFAVAVGETKQIPLGFYSDGATNDWTIKATEGSPFSKPSSTPRLVLALDKTSGQNGEMAYLSVTVKTASTTKGELLTITSTMGGQKHYMPIMIGSM